MKSSSFLVLLLISAAVHAGEPLDDKQLDTVTAGADGGDADELLKFSAQHETASGHTIKVDGSVDLDKVRTINAASLQLQDSAQSNLRSLVNINAVQSSVNVLLNLNIMIDSHIGDLRQLNLTAK
jgi:hypothetical protein